MDDPVQSSVFSQPVIPNPPLPDDQGPQNAAVARCVHAWERTHGLVNLMPKKDRVAEEFDSFRTHECNAAFRKAMPPLVGHQNIQEFIACVTYAWPTTSFASRNPSASSSAPGSLSPHCASAPKSDRGKNNIYIFWREIAPLSVHSRPNPRSNQVESAVWLITTLATKAVNGFVNSLSCSIQSNQPLTK